MLAWTDGSSHRRTTPGATSSVSAGTSSRCPAIRSIFSRISRAAASMAPAPAIIVRLANPPTLYGVPRESPRCTTTSAGSSPRSEAATCENVVSVDWPKLDTPV
jgi:hypothetical protein